MPESKDGETDVTDTKQWAEFMNLANAVTMLFEPEVHTRKEGERWVRIWLGSLTLENKQRVVDAIKALAGKLDDE